MTEKPRVRPPYHSLGFVLVRYEGSPSAVRWASTVIWFSPHCVLSSTRAERLGRRKLGRE